MKKIAEVWVQAPTGKIKKPFSYEIPEKFSFLTPGWRVLIPWGSRLLDGVVLSISKVEDDHQFEYPIRKIADIFDDSAFYSTEDISLAQWIAEEYFCSLGDALKLFVPGGKEGKDETLFCWNEEEKFDDLSVEQKEIALWICNNQPVSSINIIKKFPVVDAPFLSRWNKEGKLISERQYRRISKPKQISFFQISSQGISALEGNLVRGKVQLQALEILKNGELDKECLRNQGISSESLKALLAKNLITERTALSTSEVSNCLDSAEWPMLTSDQEVAFNKIQSSQIQEKYDEFLLFGITGSGKTEIYIRAVEETLKKEKGAIVLTPEIALTSQLVHRFEKRFGNQIVVFHSSMSLGEKRTAWAKVRNGEASIVIGARSALFAPIKNLGIIILDEEHEFTYKQEDHPRYHAREVARKRAEIENSVLILGSATPSLESYYQAITGKSQLLELPERIGESVLPQIQIVDMRKELKSGNKTILSLAMRNLITTALDKKEQVILLMNRRGYSTFVICRECGYVAKCEDCHVSLVFHQGDKMLKCHYCHGKHEIPEICPTCSSTYIRFFGSGTEKVEEVIRENYPSAAIARLDRDTTTRKGAGEKILKDFRKGKTDILIGTQMVAKGHDIPNVTAIGIISADTVLHIPDFRSAEQTFSLLTQAAGRSGRGDNPGEVVIQTYSPDEPAIMDAAKQDYKDFAMRELEERKILSYPPFTHLFKCTIFQGAEHSVRQVSLEITKELAQYLEVLEFLGPYPEVLPYRRTTGQWYQHILIKTTEPEKATKILTEIKNKYDGFLTIDRDPIRIF